MEGATDPFLVSSSSIQYSDIQIVQIGPLVCFLIELFQKSIKISPKLVLYLLCIILNLDLQLYIPLSIIIHRLLHQEYIADSPEK